ncbi:nucleoside triphosphate pyrophosphohydrolase [Fibrobacter sp. UWR2]|uniref:nucleoside triphosphate pyrophosphohydrolase n=1 Tax=Fibrobacter sp. UWR2 TaxID=1964352 RepID=UPI000B529472|nr:nucleoside triphosphate pyrophosphohydrolase [Fibrobacter sp. UWR2]OWV00426.1 nucleoside triphosphate pyrophosphohydrolase [Fibrobacter sp. UWR2]
MKYTFDDLVDILKRLRAEDGCPWDRAQDTHTLLPYLVEESSEFIDAALDGDKAHMCEELGDVLLQVVFHAQVCREQGDFTIDDVVQGICEKMIRRHPHVFGDAQVDTAGEVSRRWEKIKAQETMHLHDAEKSVMDKVSKSMPTLARTQDIIRRVAKVGFDWGEAAPVFDKAQEEFAEFRAEMEKVTPENANTDRLEDEFGDIMFCLVNVARHSGFNADVALRRANAKFEKRFREVERLAAAQGKQVKDIGLDGLQNLWKQAKNATR